MGNSVYKVKPENESLQSNLTENQTKKNANNNSLNYGSIPQTFIRRDSQTLYNGYSKVDSFNYQKIKDD